MKPSREWATPLAIGIFGLMAVTGLLMFFHWDNRLQKTVHEWAGWLVVVAIGLHVAVNWHGFKRHFRLRLPAAAILIVCLVAIVGSFAGAFVGLPNNQENSPPALAIAALTRTPIRLVAPVFGKTAAQARAQLEAAGISLADDEATLADAIGGDRDRIGRALAVLSDRRAAN